MPTSNYSFDAVSLLTTNNGMLEVTLIPALNQPDWIIPTSLILAIDECAERMSSYQWQQQSLAVFHLLPYEQLPDKLIILEANTELQRFALQTAGALRNIKVKISEVKDSELPAYYINETNISAAPFSEKAVLSYLFQTVVIDEVFYLVPDLDKIAEQLAKLEV
jgi:hypothetical protein